jgi:2-polyprenyl-6-methoxyphenol hydroxylase-like FAD-dependent oxidoreductase
MGTNAVIVGGGIGGLAAAIALRGVGVEARVFERAPELTEVGAGLSLWPNGIAALDRIGLGAQVRQRSVPDMDGALRSWRGRTVVATDGAALQRLLGDVSLIIHRADLLALLRDALPASSLVTSATCTEFRDEGRSVTALFADGTRGRGDFLVGADGIHSTVRAGLFGAAPPVYAGYTAWRAITAFEHSRLRAGVSIGRGCQFGQVPMADGRVYWFATENAPAGRPTPAAGERAALLELFGDWHDPIPDLVSATDAAAILHNDIFDRSPVERWGSGRVTLLGDAAHAMTPNLGQGANQALQDAVALAAAVTDAAAGDLEPALRAYERVRLRRANAVVSASRQVGRVMQLESPLACRVRDALLGTRAARWMQLSQLRRFAARGA